MMKLLIVAAMVVAVAFAAVRIAPEDQHLGPDPATQHWGYITVNGTYKNGAHLFYWMFESRNNPQTDPLVCVFCEFERLSVCSTDNGST
jgi:hypothetical protein